MPRNGEKTEVNIRCCNGKSITFGFHTDFTGQQVFNLCKDKFEIERFSSHFSKDYMLHKLCSITRPKMAMGNEKNIQ